jgi:GAF domain-containing protein
MTGDEDPAPDRGDPARPAVGSSGQPTRPGIARTMSELSRQLHAEPTTESLLQHIVDAAVREIPGAGCAGITLFRSSGIETPAASGGDLVCQVDQLQYDTGQGPCLDSAHEHLTARCDDLRTETRWPQFASRAAGLGVRSVLAVQLYADEDDFGALNMYSPDPAAFDTDSEDTGILLASHAAIAIAARRRETSLHATLDTRDLIGQAKGRLMERHDIDAMQAFAMIMTAARTTGQKIRTVAGHLARTGELPATSSQQS